MKRISVQFFTFLVLLFVLEIQCKRKIPDYLQICKRDPDTIDNCVKNSIHNLRDYLKVGIPELRVPAVEPLIIPEVGFDLGGVVNFKGVGKNIKVFGMGDYTFKSISVDLDELIFVGLVHFPKLRFDGDFDIDARLFVVPYHGSGHIDMNTTECVSELTLYGKIEEKKGKGYMKFTKITMDLSVDDFTPKYENFNAGGIDISEVLTRVMNENKVDFFRAIKPFVEFSASEYIRKVSNRIANTFPFDDLMPLP